MSEKPPEMCYRITGMDCAEEVTVLKQAVGPIVGGEERLAFDILNGRMTVRPGPDEVKSEEVVAAVARTGMRAKPWTALREQVPVTFLNQHGRTVLTAVSGVSVALGLATHVASAGWYGAFGSEGMGLAEAVPLAAKLFYTVAIVTGTWLVLPKAVHAARSLRPDMNLLMVVAVTGAVAIGEWFEAATVAFLFAVSLALEAWSVGRARRAIAALLELAPPLARIRDASGEHEVPPDQVVPGTLFIVRPGEKVPLDGTVRTGTSAINQAPITGESVPVPKQPGDPAYAGTVNGDGLLEIESTKAADDTTLAQIVQMVGAAQSRRAPSEQWVEQFARYYTPAVMGLALFVLLVPPLLFGALWVVWLYRALVLLVIACPCALVISTPVSVVAALAAAARHGVLIKGGAFVEAPAHLRAIAMDKTGTLTAGRPAVVGVFPINGHTETDLLQRAAALEAGSTHPLAVAVLAYARQSGVEPMAVTEMQAVPGKGVVAKFDGRPFWLGSHRYLEERGQETPEVHERLETLTAEGKTVVVIGNDQHVCGFIGLADTVRPEAKEAIARLKALGVAHVVMLTGDNRGTAKVIGREAGVDEVRAELLPADKVAAVEEIVRDHGSTAMVGDGVNDAPAMARATIGIAMGAVGSDAAIETADIALMADDLAKLPWLIGHARRTLAIIRQNIYFSLAVKGLFAALAMVGFASLWAAIAADAGASLLVIANGLRLLCEDG